MDEKALEVLEQYDLEVIRTWKGRGVYFAETSAGLHMLKEHRGSEEKLEKLRLLLDSMESVQFFKTDLPVQTKEGTFLSKDSEEVTYLLKKWREGRECDPRNELDICRAMEGLAIFHTAASGIWKFTSPEERTKYEGSSLADEMEKHTRELKKVQTFIRKKQKKSAFESCYLEIIPEFLKEALEITQKMQDSDYEILRQEAFDAGKICHGEYMQHNVLFDRSKLIMTNFEHARLDLQCVDVALFLRKVMEKQGWKAAQGEKFLRAYEIVRPMNDHERQILALRMAYPEKLWKLANHYYHTNKAWIPAKNLEKLKMFASQQKERERFIQQILPNSLTNRGKNAITVVGM